jgi:hypothetical protein
MSKGEMQATGILLIVEKKTMVFSSGLITCK